MMSFFAGARREVAGDMLDTMHDVHLTSHTTLVPKELIPTHQASHSQLQQLKSDAPASSTMLQSFPDLQNFF